MATKHPKTNRVAVSLYFDGSKFVAKLVRRVPGPNYKKAGDVVETAFDDVFGQYEHKSGTPQWSKKGADPDMADQVAARLSLHEEILSVTYKRPPSVTIPRPSLEVARRKTGTHKAAIETLKRALFGDKVIALGIDGEIADTERSINKTMKRLADEQNALEGLKARRAQLMETIKALGG